MWLTEKNTNIWRVLETFLAGFKFSNLSFFTSTPSYLQDYLGVPTGLCANSDTSREA